MNPDESAAGGPAQTFSILASPKGGLCLEYHVSHERPNNLPQQGLEDLSRLRQEYLGAYNLPVPIEPTVPDISQYTTRGMNEAGAPAAVPDVPDISQYTTRGMNEAGAPSSFGNNGGGGGQTDIIPDQDDGPVVINVRRRPTRLPGPGGM